MSVMELVWAQGYLLGFAVGWAAATALCKYQQRQKERQL